MDIDSDNDSVVERFFEAVDELLDDEDFVEIPEGFFDVPETISTTGDVPETMSTTGTTAPLIGGQGMDKECKYSSKNSVLFPARCGKRRESVR